MATFVPYCYKRTSSILQGVIPGGGFGLKGTRQSNFCTRMWSIFLSGFHKLTVALSRFANMAVKLTCYWDPISIINRRRITNTYQEKVEDDHRKGSGLRPDSWQYLKTRHQLVTKLANFWMFSDQVKPEKQGRQRDLAAVPHNWHPRGLRFEPADK